jgi:hypothetical protein
MLQLEIAFYLEIEAIINFRLAWKTLIRSYPIHRIAYTLAPWGRNDNGLGLRI